MNKQKNFYVKSFFLLVLFAITITGCKKEKVVDTNSPAYKIDMSEKLFIPLIVDLPSNQPGGNSRVATYFAEGVQKYKAQLKTGSTNEYEWVFVAPDAKLYDAANKLTGTHGAGPHWTLSAVDSIFAQHFAPAKTSPSPDANSIDWLLLLPKNGKTPTGFFRDVAYIQRIATVGGKAPTALPVSANATTEVPYTAIYRFTKKNP
jgi:Protein of unknown function (DUF3455)